MAKNLLIVESPAKAKTIEKYLGGDFSVKSSFGHIRDLSKGDNAVNIEKEYEPQYIIPEDKQKIVNDLRNSVKKVQEVWLATDEDREGEAISWHLCKVLGLDEKTTKRIVFREITKTALQKAIESPRTVDLDLVDAQQARRILDRLVGFELSGLLWKKMRFGLSAGRVQSVAVKLIVDRERDIENFTITPFYKVSAIFKVRNKMGKLVELKAEMPTRFEAEKDATDFLNKCIGATFTVGKIDVKPAKRKPAAPFITSTLQQDASRKLGFSVSRTMTVAQRLYEAGFITYMRTDSTNLSETALQAAAEEITKKYGEKYQETRRYKKKSSSAQEAHEAIRPTNFAQPTAGANRDQQRLYELIWKRTIASQMSDAQLEKTKVDINISTLPDARLVANGEVLKFDGFLKVYLESTDDEEENEAKGILPPLSVGQVLDLDYMTAIERFTRPPARYTEASLVKKMEEMGIGRPSTYAPTISKITEKTRGYILKEPREGKERKYNVYTLKNDNIGKVIQSEITGADKNKLYPSDTGMLVTDFLTDHFDNIMDYKFTANIEEKFDEIAHGQEKWREMIDRFYKPFHKDVEETLEKAERVTGERILGKDPESGRTVLVRLSRNGPVVQIGAPDELAEDEKPRYANLKPDQAMSKVELEDVLDLFQLPKNLGNYEEKEVIIGRGRYGPYVKYDEKFISIPRDEDPLEVKMERAIQLIEIKRKEDAPAGTYDGVPYTKGKGRFGPFLKWKDLFINIPRRFDPETLTEPEAQELIKAKIEKEANRYIHNWEDLGLSVQNARWGPIIKLAKKQYKLLNEDGKRMTPEQAKELNLEQVKAIVSAQDPTALDKIKPKKKPAKKKSAKKK